MSQTTSQANRIITLTLEPNDPRRLANLSGQRDEHFKLIEERLGVTLRNRGNTFQLIRRAQNSAQPIPLCRKTGFQRPHTRMLNQLLGRMGRIRTVDKCSFGPFNR